MIKLQYLKNCDEQPLSHYVRNFNISKMFKDASNTIQNFMFMAATVFEIAGGGGGRRPSFPWYQVWVPKGFVNASLIKYHQHFPLA